MLIDIGAKGAADERNVAKNWDLILGFLHIFTHQSTQHHRLAVGHADACGDFARAEHRLINHVRSELDGHRCWNNTTNGINADCVNGAAIIDEALKLYHLRNQV